MNFSRDQWDHENKTTIYKLIQHIMKKNLLLLNNSLEFSRLKSTNIWPQFQEMCVLDDIVNKYNNTYHRTIKMKPTDVNSIQILTLMLKIMINILHLKFLIM